MAANFRTRPWRLAPAPSALISSFLVAPRPLASSAGQTRSYAKRMHAQLRGHAGNMMRASRGQPATSSMTSEMMQEKVAQSPAELAVMAPGTVVSLSWTKAIKLLTADFQLFRSYYWMCLKQRFSDKLAMMQLATRAKGGYFAKYRNPGFKPTTKGLPAVATELHYEMSSAMARGSQKDQDALAKICTPKLYRSLHALIENRPAGKSYKWERLELLGRPFWQLGQSKERNLHKSIWPFWPRVVDHKWTEIPMGQGVMLSFRQAVVGIKSRQRLTRLDAKGQVVGTPKEMVLTEYLVLWRRVDEESQSLGPWLISGTLKETTPEQLVEEQAHIKRLAEVTGTAALEASRAKAGAKS